jgi:regulator of replication initiation timing
MIDDYERAYKRLKEVYEDRLSTLDKYPDGCHRCSKFYDIKIKLDKLSRQNRELALENWRLRKKMQTILC